jgi:integrase
MGISHSLEEIAMAVIPKGIFQVTWKNKNSKTKQVKYQVKVTIKGIKYNKLCDTLKEAEEHLSNLRSPAGIVKVREYDEKLQTERKAVKDFLDSPPFSIYVKNYIKKYIEIKDDGTDLKKRNIQSDISRITRIIDREVEYTNKMFGNLSIVLTNAMKAPKKKLSQFKLEEIDDVVITNYIRMRLDKNQVKIPAKSTVKREVDTLSGIFTKIRFLDKHAFLTKLKGDNPCHTADISLLAGFHNPIKQRIKEDKQEVILKELSQFPNKEMLYIFSLALTTGMRRSEIISLEWQQVKLEDKKIILKKTKSNQVREVTLTEDAIAVLGTIPKNDDKLFHYTLDGFNSNWQRIKKRGGFKEVRLHDTRREFISSMLQLCSSSIVVADMIGMSDINHFDKSYNDETNLDSQQGIMKSIGHNRKSTTKGYFTK